MLCAQKGGENGGSDGKEDQKKGSNVFCEAFDWRGTVPGGGLSAWWVSWGRCWAPAWPGAGGRHWVKALDERALSLGLWLGPEGLIVLLTVLVPPFLQYKKKKKEKKILNQYHDSDNSWLVVLFTEHTVWWTEKKDTLSWNQWHDYMSLSLISPIVPHAVCLSSCAKNDTLNQTYCVDAGAEKKTKEKRHKHEHKESPTRKRPFMDMKRHRLLAGW